MIFMLLTFVVQATDSSTAHASQKISTSIVPQKNSPHIKFTNANSPSPQASNSQLSNTDYFQKTPQTTENTFVESDCDSCRNTPIIVFLNTDLLDIKLLCRNCFLPFSISFKSHIADAITKPNWCRHLANR